MILHGAIRQRLTLTPQQIGVILGLENLLKASGLILLCPNCLDDGDPFLDTDNDPQAPEWKIDCQCRERRILRGEVGTPFDADGDLIAAALAVLSPIRLAVRCPERRCVRHALELERTPTHTILRCRCAKTTLRLLPQTVH